MPPITEEQKKNPNFNPNYNLQFGGAINSTQLTQSPTLSVTQPQIPPIPTVPSPAPTPEQQAPDALSNIEQQLQSQLGANTLEQRTLAATAPAQQRLSQLDARIAGYDAASLRRQEQALQSGETLQYSTGLAGQVARTDAIERLALLAERQAITGDIAAAERTAKIAVDAQFAEQEAKNQAARQNIINNYDSFTAAEKKRADAALLKLDKDDAFVAQAKEDRAAIASTANLVAKNGFGDIAAKVREAKTSDEAFKLAASYLQDPKDALALEVLRVEKKMKEWEYRNRGAPTATERKEMEAKEATRKNALDVAGNTLTKAKQLQALIQAGKGNSIIGGSRILTGGRAIPGTQAANVQALFDTIKDNLALGNIDKLKGAMSDKDIEFLRNTATNLRLTQSEASFNATLDEIIARMDGRVNENLFSADEQSMLDEAFNTPALTAASTPASYFNQ